MFTRAITTGQLPATKIIIHSIHQMHQKYQEIKRD